LELERKVSNEKFHEIRTNLHKMQTIMVTSDERQRKETTTLRTDYEEQAT